MEPTIEELYFMLNNIGDFISYGLFGIWKYEIEDKIKILSPFFIDIINKKRKVRYYNNEEFVLDIDKIIKNEIKIKIRLEKLNIINGEAIEYQNTI
jgi:hypothetical protein